MKLNFLEVATSAAKEETFLNYTLGDALETAGIGMGTVIAVLALIAVCVIVISKIIRTIENKGTKDKVAVADVPAAPAAPVSNELNGAVELIDVDEKTAAVIMAIVSNESGIDVNRLAFKSIKLMED